MPNNDTTVRPVELFARASQAALAAVAGVPADGWGRPTPCAGWDVRALVDHLVSGAAYLRAAMAEEEPRPVAGATASAYRSLLDDVARAAAEPGALARRCRSPLGTGWSVAEAFAGTFMDTLVHTWDVAVATGQDATLDPALVEACTAMFLPGMPERGRAAGLVGPAVAVGPDASPQARLLGAMGRRP